MKDDFEELFGKRYEGLLYKYHGISKERKNYLEGILLKDEIYFSQPSSLNDPFDCRSITLLSGSEAERKKWVQNGINKNFPNLNRSQRKLKFKEFYRLENFKKLERDQELLFRGSTDLYGIFSMSEKNDNILMWSHYAEQHKGVCLVFVAESKDRFFNNTVAVQYPKNNEIPIVNILKTSGKDDIAEYKEISDMFVTKSAHWEYEAERRLINEPKKTKEGKVITGWGLHKFPSCLLTGIILGCEMKSGSKTFLRKTLKKRSGTKIKVSQAKKKERHYGLDIIDITEEFYAEFAKPI